MVELLAPAGSLDALKAAVNAGADAVYIGGSMFGARAYADNPQEDALIEGLEYCHLHKRKLYMTVNTLLKEQELQEKLYSYLLPYYIKGLDGVIVQDLGVVAFIQKHFPLMEVHASTQMTITSVYSAQVLKAQGLTRVVPARELSLEEIRRIIDETGIEVETFIHGAMCYCYSGQCLLSSMIGGRSGNRGRCAQPCRLPYKIGKKESCVLSMKDMCSLDLIPNLIDAGIASFKIEGRMKRPEYTAGVVSIYRKYIDLYQKKGRKGYRIQEADRTILMDLYNRGGFSEGYYQQHNGPEMMSMQRPNHWGTDAATVISVKGNNVRLQALEDLNKKDVLEFTKDQELTLNESVKKGAAFQMHVARYNGKPGALVRRTKNNELLKFLSKTFCEESLQVKIKGNLRISAYAPAILEVSYGTVTVRKTKDIAQEAKTNSAAVESVQKQMQKTGQTAFVFESLQIELDDGLFIPVKLLNELRREALDELLEKVLGKYQREEYLEERCVEKSIDDRSTEGVDSDRCDKACYDATNDAIKVNSVDIDAVPSVLKMNVLFTSSAQAEACLKFSDLTHFDTVYLDSILWTQNGVKDIIERIQAAGLKVFLSFPPVFRSKDQKLLANKAVLELLEKADGYLVHTFDQLCYLLEKKQKGELTGHIAADESVYAYNTCAADYLKKHGICRRTLPAELNLRELKQCIIENESLELNVYGHQPLMHSAQCVTKNTSKCTGIPEFLWIRDRKNAEFPVLNRCNVCCNTIYNSVPLQLGSCAEDIKALPLSYIRLSFTVEEMEMTMKILNVYESIFYSSTSDLNDHSSKSNQPTNLEIQKILDGTRGHFRRGVE